MKKQKCCLCGKTMDDIGNNAMPLKQGRCCDDCNDDVIMERIKEAERMSRRFENEQF